MLINRYVHYFLILGFILFSGSILPIKNVKAIDVTSPSYSFWMKHSDRVARVKIVHRKQIKCEESKYANIGGWLNTVKVVKGWKGGEEDFTFFTPYDDEFIDFKRDYFVLARKGIFISEIAEVDPLEKYQISNYETMKCDNNNYVYSVITNVQSVFPFDIEAPKNFGSEWLILLPRRANAQISIMSEYHDIYDNDKNPESFKYTIQKWCDFLNDMIHGKE